MKIKFEYCPCDNVEYKEAHKTGKVCMRCKLGLIYRVELDFKEKKYA